LVGSGGACKSRSQGNKRAATAAAAKEAKAAKETPVDKDEKLELKRNELEMTKFMLAGVNVAATNMLGANIQNSTAGKTASEFLSEQLDKRSVKELRDLVSSIESSNGESSRTLALAKTLFKEQFAALDAMAKGMKHLEAYAVCETSIKFVELFQEGTYISWKSYKAFVNEVGQYQ
jgi:hypothetical protein